MKIPVCLVRFRTVEYACGHKHERLKDRENIASRQLREFFAENGCRLAGKKRQDAVLGMYCNRAVARQPRGLFNGVPNLAAVLWRVEWLDDRSGSDLRDENA